MRSISDSLFHGVRLRTKLTMSYAGFVVLVGGVSWATGHGLPLLACGLGMAVAVLAGSLMGRSLAQPLGRLRDAATAVGQGRWSYDLSPPSHLELREVVSAFVMMRKALLGRFDAVSEASSKLEGDAEQRRQYERAIRQAQKMEAIGRLAGGVAHEFNNMLSIILGYSGIALDGLRPEDPLFIPLTEIKQAGERSSELTRRLLTLSRNQVQETKVLDAAVAVEAMSRSIQRVLGEKSALDLHCESTPCRVETARGQIEQLVMNLVVNARDAMPDGGTLTVDVRLLDLSVAEAEREVGLRPGRQVRIRVSDTGVGMPVEVQERVFEPFFTTKVQGMGAGLGLATVFGFTQQRGGHVSVRSVVGEGTTFDVYLPEAGPQALAARELPSSGATRAARTILVVEDEEQVRVVMERILRRHRYGVLVAGSPQEALSICEGHPGRIDLLVTDVAMAEMNGQVLAEQLLERRPEMKVLFVSGYLNDVVLQPADDGDAQAFLQKPVTPEALRQKVRGILRATSVPPSHRGNA